MLVRREADSAVDLTACLDLQVEVLVVTFTCFYWRQIMKVTHNCLFFTLGGILATISVTHLCSLPVYQSMEVKK